MSTYRLACGNGETTRGLDDSFSKTSLNTIGTKAVLYNVEITSKMDGLWSKWTVLGGSTELSKKLKVDDQELNWILQRLDGTKGWNVCSRWIELGTSSNSRTEFDLFIWLKYFLSYLLWCKVNRDTLDDQQFVEC